MFNRPGRSQYFKKFHLDWCRSCGGIYSPKADDVGLCHDDGCQVLKMAGWKEEDVNFKAMMRRRMEADLRDNRTWEQKQAEIYAKGPLARKKAGIHAT